MSEKPDFYTVLGVDKKASTDDIKAAFKKIAMRCHPDMLRNKTEAEKKTAGEKFQLAKEAHEVLTDSSKRATYDRFGHKGLDNIKGSSSTGQSYTDAAGPILKKTYSEEDTASFFTRRAEKPTSTGTDGPAETTEQRRARAAEERRKAREEQRKGTSSTPSVTETFRDVSEKVGDAANRLKDAIVPVEALERFRENLKDFLKEVDAAIERSRKKDNPGYKP